LSEPAFDVDRFRRAFLLLLVLLISLAFLWMIAGFLSAVLLAAIATGLCYPFHARLSRLLGGRANIASVITILLVLVVIIGPLLGFMGVVAKQALEVSDSIRPWLSAQMSSSLNGPLLERFVLPEVLQPYQSQILAKAGELTATMGQFLLNSVAAATRGTASFILSLFVMLYAMFFFLRDGGAILSRILYYMPLKSEDELRMVDKFVSVSRATLKGTLVIGIVQGTLAGVALALAGITGSAFWGTVMAVLSIIPGVGTALVWVPAVIWLYASGQVLSAVLVAAWCAGVVGTVDNVLRPWLVGRDTQMSDLIILLSTLGGLMAFGAIGILVGPILAALFVTVWELYGEAFSDYLPEVELAEASAASVAGEQAAPD
jgi:predicted PurR-regulated permease PerM